MSGPERERGPAPGGGEPYSGPVHDFDESYRAGVPPWDIGRPQPVFLGLADAGAIIGRVLDAGCGTGEHVLMAAGRGLDATGIDFAPAAIEMAEGKAAARGVVARFAVWDALHLADLGEQFDTVLDCGLFHVFEDDERPRYVDSLRAVLQPGGRVLMCCFSEHQPGEWGPRRVRQDEIRRSFAGGWTVDSIEPAQLDLNLGPGTALAWLARIGRR